MSENTEVSTIIAKYNHSITDLSNNGTIKELKTVFNYFALQSNKRQRQMLGLED